MKKVDYTAITKLILTIEHSPKHDVDRGLMLTYKDKDGEAQVIITDLRKGQTEYSLPEDFDPHSILDVKVIPTND